MFCYHLDYQHECQQQMQLLKKTQKHHGSGTTALIVSNKEMEDIRKIVKLREESGLQMKRISETIENEIKE